jgi:hypothetical protein
MAGWWTLRKGDKVEAFIRSFAPTPTSVAAASGREHWWAVVNGDAREELSFSVNEAPPNLRLVVRSFPY